MRSSILLPLVASFALLAPSASWAQAPSRQNALKANTRLITVDVVATDSHGDVVRGLSEKDFKVYEDRGVPQEISRFEFVDSSIRAAANNPRAPQIPGLFSNRNMRAPTFAPTVILLDALNTGTVHRMQIRHYMILFLHKIPPDTPVAVFLLGDGLQVVQNFTTDPTILRTAVERISASGMDTEKYPEDDANSASNQLQEADPQAPASVVQSLQNFEKTQYLEMTQQRVSETADAMREIAKYLSGYPGRKNVIWFSEAFPIWIEPDSDFGSDPFMGSGSFEDKVQAAAASLMDAGVAVYPVDARGLETDQAYSAENGITAATSSPAGFAGGLSRENQLRLNSQATMDEVADETGGRTCKNTNDLSGCVFQALKEDSSYYELSYYPTGIKWDNQFHKISVKTTVHGVSLNYRRGFIATDSAVLMKHEDPVKLLKDVCRDPLPSSAIGMSVAALPPDAKGPSANIRYLLTVSPNALTLEPDGQSMRIDAHVAICEFDPAGDNFAFYPKNLSGPVTDASLQSWKKYGVRNIFDYQAKPEDRRLRFAVVDLPSGETGSVDVPAHPTKFIQFATTRLSPKPASAPPVPPQPAPAAAPANPPAPTHVNFRLPSGKGGSLDWSGDKLVYQGDLGIEMSVPAFFQSVYGAKFHCEAGQLKPNDSSSGTPNFVFNFHNSAGLVAVVDLGGAAPSYSGTLPVDPTAKAFFDRLWKSCHCTAP
ncbi:MAG TPA: VWA domain-containing protein [Candidatus Dormibacteraeota bacterium]|nr:VWA domain-containing protein [Candidatus Dormibacteraeota bacterium]